MLGCTSLQINWESALTGVIRGPEGTGSIPVPGVTIDWSFASDPSAKGTGTTNSNGQFVDSTGTIGFDFQVWLRINIDFSLVLSRIFFSGLSLPIILSYS